MIKIIKNNSDIKILGHAGYQEYGQDIVCASVSSIIYTTVNAIKNIDSDAIEFIDDNNLMEIKVLKKDDIIDKLIQNMLDLLNDLSKQYPNNISVVEKNIK